MNEDDYEMYDEGEAVEDPVCKYCHGDGGDPYNDGILPCPRCNGEGYEWWK